jgi:hypothetical protein
VHSLYRARDTVLTQCGASKCHAEILSTFLRKNTLLMGMGVGIFSFSVLLYSVLKRLVATHSRRASHRDALYVKRIKGGVISGVHYLELTNGLNSVKSNSQLLRFYSFCFDRRPVQNWNHEIDCGSNLTCRS